MKAIPFVFVIGVIVLLSCVGQESTGPGAITTGTVYFSITDKQLDMANVTSVDVTISQIMVHTDGFLPLAGGESSNVNASPLAAEYNTADCEMSLCDCKCHPVGQTPEALNGTLCGINCLGEFNVTRCKKVNDTCQVITKEESDQLEGRAWITVLNESKTYDLMALSGVEELISSAELTHGYDYNILRLYISEVKVTYNGVKNTAKLPSGKIDISISIPVASNTSSLVSLDFNLNDSLHITGDGQIIMAPVIKVDVSRDVELQIQNRIVTRVRAEREVQKEVGMDENGSVGEGKRIRADLNLTIGGDGQIRVQERARNETEQQGQPQQYDVNARINGFTPSTLTIKVGDTVRWVFRDQFAHRLVSDAAGFDSMARYQDQVWAYTFNTAGTFAYRDSINAIAQGTIIVEQ